MQQWIEQLSQSGGGLAILGGLEVLSMCCAGNETALTLGSRLE